MAISEEMVRENLLTVAEAADELGIRPRSMHRAAEDGRIRLLRLGARKFITRDELAAYREKAKSYGTGRPRNDGSRPETPLAAPEGWSHARDAAVRLGVTRQRLTQLVASGVLDRRKHGSSSLISLASLTRYERARREPPIAPSPEA